MEKTSQRPYSPRGDKELSQSKSCFFLFYDGDAKIYTKLLTQCNDAIGNVNVTPVTSPNLIFSSVEFV